MVSNHPFGVKFNWEKSYLSILNTYALTSTKAKRKLWNDMAKCQLEGEWCLLGDFSMVEWKRDSLGSSSTLAGSKKNNWKNFTSKWALQDLWEFELSNLSMGFTYTSLPKLPLSLTD